MKKFISIMALTFGCLFIVYFVATFFVEVGEPITLDTTDPLVQDILKYEDETYIVYFYQPNCAYCRSISDDVDKFMENGDINMYKVDASDKDWNRLGLQGTPSMYLISKVDGEVVIRSCIGPDEALKLMKKYS